MKSERKRAKRKQKRKADKLKKMAYERRQKRAFLEALIELHITASLDLTLEGLLASPNGCHSLSIYLPGHSEIKVKYYLERISPKILITYEYDL